VRPPGAALAEDRSRELSFEGATGMPAPAANGARSLRALPPRFAPDGAESVFDRADLLYAFMREHLFRDDTDLIARSLWGHREPPPGTMLLELGCGPGVYTRRLAGRFRQLQALGVDLSARQLSLARARTEALGLRNCRFELGNAHALRRAPASVDAVVTARLFTVVDDATRVMGEIHRVLAPGGRCFVAEPRLGLRASLPLRALRLCARLEAMLKAGSRGPLLPASVAVLGERAFGALIDAPPWAAIEYWSDVHYQYALCTKAAGAPRSATRS